MSCSWYLHIACDLPIVVNPSGIFDYLPQVLWTPEGEELTLTQPDAWVGRAVLVPFGAAAKSGKQKQIVGWVVGYADYSDVSADKLKQVHAILPSIPRAAPEWLDLMRFIARYYQRGLGEVMLMALPNTLRFARSFRWHEDTQTGALKQGQRAWQKWLKIRETPTRLVLSSGLNLNPEQQAVLSLLPKSNPNLGTNSKPHKPHLIFGVTGSGKTELYLHYIAHILQTQTHAQVLVLLPEINLTPQFLSRLHQRFGMDACVALHSRLNEAERLLAWWRASSGHARIVLGTRLAVLTPLPHLQCIIVDEEHDSSYRQQEGVRYSARDIAIYRAHALNIPIVLGSATPSLESWTHAQHGKYVLHQLKHRAVSASQLPQVRLIAMGNKPPADGIGVEIEQAVSQALAQGNMSLLFHNRRGYSPVIYCNYCGWMPPCSACSTHLVYHKTTRRLHCHICGHHRPLPKSCPSCGHLELHPLGMGTQRLEESIRLRWPEARVLRLDADTTRAKGEMEHQLNEVTAGQYDIIVGTQMLAKGHDWPSLTVVGVLDADSGLFAHDYRAPEKMFAQLQQVLGRAGRGANAGQVIIQTRFTDHYLWPYLLKHDYEGFAKQELKLRTQLNLPPLGAHALLQVGANQYVDAAAFAHEARRLALEWLNEQGALNQQITLNAVVPMQTLRVNHSERAQLLIEATSRRDLHAFLPHWITAICRLKAARVLTWIVEVDPMEI